MAHDGTAGVGFSEPRQGWFTASHEDLATEFKPEQIAYICVRVAKFADGVHAPHLASEWTWKALSLAEGHPQAWTVVTQFVRYGLPWELLENRFERAGKLCRFNIKLGIQELLANRKPENDTPEQQAMLANLVSSGAAPPMSFARVMTVIPIVFRVATLVLQGSTPSELEVAIAALEAETDTCSEAEGFAGSLRRCFLDAADGQTLMNEAVVAHNSSEYVKSYTLRVGAIVRFPPAQSLYSQIHLMQTLSRMFLEQTQLFGSVIAPFFVEYWRELAERVLHPFRTAQSHTLRQLELSDGTIAGTRKILSAMRFCLGADLPSDAMSWLVS